MLIYWHSIVYNLFKERLSKIRSSTVEPVLGTLINFLNMKRVNTRGINQANKHVLMAALCYNLKKYMNFKSPKVISEVKSMEINKKGVFFNNIEAVSDLIKGFLSNVAQVVALYKNKIRLNGILFWWVMQNISHNLPPENVVVQRLPLLCPLPISPEKGYSQFAFDFQVNNLKPHPI